MKKRLVVSLAIMGLLSFTLPAADIGPWSTNKANAWLNQVGWLAGCNFGPSSAINQLEMWQADSFDPATMDRELGWAQQLGFNSVRVFLQDQLWQQDAQGLLERMEKFLTICERHKIGVMFVLFDSCWDPFPKLGQQRAPKPHVHNSGWVQSPGLELLTKPERYDSLKPYVQGVIGHFKNDRRVQVWDLFNEPDNRNNSSYGQHEPANKSEYALALLKKTYAWAREVNPSQPLTAGVWIGNWPEAAKLSAMERLCLEQSDVITFHCYGVLGEMQKCVDNLRRYHRPILCTEYMSRGNRSTFDPILGYLKSQNVAAYNWGLVAGKTQTIYPWDSWGKTYQAEPALWFHDIFRANGTAYDPKEVAYIKSVTARK